MIEPTQTCHLCGNSVVVVPEARGFPPDIARGKLRRLCQSQGCTCDPHYTAGISPELLAKMRATEEFHALIRRLNAIREELDEVHTMIRAHATGTGFLSAPAAVALCDELDEARALAFELAAALRKRREPTQTGDVVTADPLSTELPSQPDSVADEINGLRDLLSASRTIGIYLVMWWSPKNWSTNILGAYESEERAGTHAARAFARGLRTGDKVWVKEQVLHLGVDEAENDAETEEAK